MGPASETQIIDRGLTAMSHRLDMIELEKPALFATMALLGDERALISVSCPHRPTHMGWDMPGILTIVVQSAPRAIRGPKLTRLGGPNV